MTEYTSSNRIVGTLIQIKEAIKRRGYCTRCHQEQSRRLTRSHRVFYSKILNRKKIVTWIYV